MVSGSAPKRDKSDKAKALHCPRSTRGYVASRCSGRDCARSGPRFSGHVSGPKPPVGDGTFYGLSLLGTSLCDASSGASHPLQFLSAPTCWQAD
ncbi:hypothetical protein HPB50_016973 [Hyalomma asiaticum]|uniref:Uncharacterized protein n=1 Tax=Hyalomma asiaticum TaxID=266040 RepID=A0ACB7RU43_HYAAI|nr:hypothetical protein HPB50_016973 [Hyalomma asiaticum]